MKQIIIALLIISCFQISAKDLDSCKIAEIDARKHVRTRVPTQEWMTMGIVFGITTGPIGATGLCTYALAKDTKAEMSYSIKNECGIKGYRRELKKQRFFHSFTGSIIGMGISMAVVTFIIMR